MRSIAVLIILYFPFVSVAQDRWSLDSCVRYALNHNISVKQSELNISLAEIDQMVAYGGLLPNLNAQGGHGYNWGQRIDPFTNQFATERIQSNNFGIATSVNLFSGFSQWNTIKRAAVNKEISKLNLEQMRNDIALNVASAFLNVVVNREVLAIAETNLANTDRQVDRLSKLVNAGQLAEGNLNDMLATRASDEASRVAAENNLNLAILSLIQLLQLSDEERAQFDIEVPVIDNIESMKAMENVNVIRDMALRNFPEIKSAEAGIVAADLNYKIAKAGAMPQLNASYSYGSGYSGAARVLSGSPDTLSFPIGQVFGSNQVVFSLPQPVFAADDYSIKPFESQLRDNVNQSLFFTLTVPLFNGFTSRGNIQRAKINSLNAQYQLDQAKLTLTQNVERAFADARAALANYNAARTSLSASEQAMQWAEKRFEQGVSNVVEYNDSRARLDNARATLLRSKYDYLFRLKILDFYMGQPINIR